MTSLAMGYEAMLRFVFIVVIQTTVMVPAARGVIAASFLIFSAVLPPISELGWPAEPALTCSAVTLGLVIGHSLDHARRLAFAAERHAADEAETKVERHGHEIQAGMAG